MNKTIYTIGYEGLDIDRFVAELQNKGVAAIADVRAVPISRKRGFSKKGLAGRLASSGLAYRHFAALGDPKPGREAARAGQYEVFERIYADHLATAPARVALRELAVFVRRQATCLLCFERDPDFCHRSRIASALLNSGFYVRHLIAEADVRHPAIRARRDACEGPPAAQHEAR